MNVAYPNLFIIGAPKCGTTALATYLGERNDVFVSDPKEPHHFSTDIGWHLTPKRRDYLSLFRNKKQDHKIICDASVFYLYSDVAVPSILEFNPDAKCIVMVRNPVDMVISMHGEARLDGFEDFADVEEAWHAHLQRANKRVGAVVPPIMEYKKVAMNGAHLQRLFQRIDSSRVLVILFDDFQNNTAIEYQRVLRFLDLPDDGRTEFPVYNAMKSVKWYRLHKFLVRTRSTLKKIGFNLHGTGLIIFFIRMSGAAKRKNIPPARFRMLLAETFREDIRLLEQILGRDLSHWLQPQPKQ